MWHMVLSCTSCFIFMNFWGIFEPFRSFHDSTRFIFEFLLKLAHISRLKVFMQYLRFFGFLYEQWSQIEVGIEKVGKILGCLKFGTADGPRVRGGQSAVNENCSLEALQRSSQPQNYTADGPPKDCGRSAGHRFIRQASDTPVVCYLARRRRSAVGPRIVRLCWEEFTRGSSSRVSVSKIS